MTSQAELAASWAAATPRTEAARGLLAGLVARYSEPHRHYHGVSHLTHVVHDVERLLRSASLPPTAAQAVRLAACYHDAVYDPRSASNERDSAALAQRELSEHLDPATIEEIERLVLATATHETVAGDHAAEVLLDADLAILGAGPSAYAAYVRGVRAEYSHVSDEGWRVGRAAVLRRLLERPVLFHTTEMSARNQRARANLTAELTSLGAVVGTIEGASGDQ